MNRMTAYAAGDIESSPHILKVWRDELLVSADKERIGRKRAVGALGVAGVPFDAGILFHSFLEIAAIDRRRSQQTLFAFCSSLFARQSVSTPGHHLSEEREANSEKRLLKTDADYSGCQSRC